MPKQAETRDPDTDAKTEPLTFALPPRAYKAKQPSPEILHLVALIDLSTLGDL